MAARHSPNAPLLPFLCFHSIREEGDGEMIRQGQKYWHVYAYVLLVAVLMGSCGKEAEENFPDADGGGHVSGEAAGDEEEKEAAETPAPEGQVVAGQQLGLVVSGTGNRAATRSLEMLEQRIKSFLPPLRAVYERERRKHSDLMGSVDAHLTITANGNVSDLRFPKSRISDARLLDAIFDPITTWVFPPADSTVQLRATLLFIPPGIDIESVVAWERQVVRTKDAAQREIVLAPSDETPSQEPSAAELPGSPPPKSVSKVVEKRTESAVTPSPPPVVKAQTPPPPPPLMGSQAGAGWYKVKRSTALRAEPRTSAALVALLKPGTRVRVVRSVAGRWLEVHSVTGRRPGYLHAADATREAEPS